MLEARRLPACGCRRAPLCCGRPLYDFGMLDRAEAGSGARRSTRCAPRSDAGVADRRARAELRRRLPRRAARPLPGRRGRQAAGAADVHARRVPRAKRRTTSRRGCAGKAHRARRTAITRRCIGIGRRATRCSTSIGLDYRGARRGLLRHGRLVRLRAGQVRRVAWRSASACCCRAVRAADARHADHRRRLQLPRADPPGQRPPRRCTWPRCCSWRSTTARRHRPTSTRQRRRSAGTSGSWHDDGATGHGPVAVPRPGGRRHRRVGRRRPRHRAGVRERTARGSR